MGRGGRKVTIDGVEYRTLTAAAKATGLSVATVQLVADGARPPVGKPLNGLSNRRRPVTVDGVEYESIEAARAATGLSRLTLRKIANGVREPTSKRLGMRPYVTGQPVTIMGVRYKSIREASDATGWSYSTVRKVAIGLRSGDIPPRSVGLGARRNARSRSGGDGSTRDGGGSGGASNHCAALRPEAREAFAMAWASPRVTMARLMGTLGVDEKTLRRWADGLNLGEKA